ncbi:MAG: uroporphyrinogen-III C-methyltransferase [Caldilineae bacterium]|nr:MAG: uroporphyrinogen-III C-methyltransferase [Caldilineae bacterium]
MNAVDVMQPGVVYLVGAGPGDPGLITVRGLRLLQQAEVVLHDRLVSPLLLAETRAGCEIIDVGKSPGGHAPAQEEIIQLLIRQARAGRKVLRLKGGDPYIFGRGGEEALALAAARIPFVLVPGVTSATAVPALAGIPLTHQHLSRSLAVVTGRTRPRSYPVPENGAQAEDPLAHLDFTALAAIDTVVVLMGVAHLAAFARRLQEAGRAPDTPVAIIENGTTPAERIVCGRLAEIARRAADADIRPPATVVIGKVVALHSVLHPAIPPSTPSFISSPDGD